MHTAFNGPLAWAESQGEPVIKGNRVIVMFTIVVALAGTVFGYTRYRRDIQAAYRRLAELDRQSTDTSCGKMEYAVQGEGYPVLVVHGAAGGFDLGLELAAAHVGAGFKVIAPSRFGYLGTPLPQDATPTTQADAFVCLLDELGIRRTAVIATSAGGPSAIQLALRYPERVSALVLISTAVVDKPMSLPPKSVVQPVVGSDFIFWLLTHPFRSVAQRMFVPDSYELAPEQDAGVAGTMHKLLLFDLGQTVLCSTYLRRIRTRMNIARATPWKTSPCLRWS